MKTFTKDKNPFTLRFSFIPPKYITRGVLTNEIVDDLRKEVPAFNGHFLTGVRGSGKSVLMAEIGKIMAESKDWYVVDVADPTGSIIEAVAKGLCRNPELKALLLEAKLDLSVLGITIKAEKASFTATDEFDAVDMILKTLKRKKKRVLVLIDEVTHNDNIGSFSHALSSYARAGYDIFVLMTGLKENIRAIKNDKSLTFLYRAKEHVLEPLNISAIVDTYAKTFELDGETSEELARLTKGYSFAFQVLGFLFWEEKCNAANVSVDSILPKMDQYLAEFVYDKIWSELAPLEKDVVAAIAASEDGKTASVRAIVKMDSSKFGVYRERLICKGVVGGQEHGRVELVLPRFGEYAKLHHRK